MGLVGDDRFYFQVGYCLAKVYMDYNDRRMSYQGSFSYNNGAQSSINYANNHAARGSAFHTQISMLNFNNSAAGINEENNVNICNEEESEV